MSTDNIHRAVTIWTQGGAAIGMGHVSRCVHIAKALSKTGVEVDFIVNGEAAVADRLKSAGFTFTVVQNGDMQAVAAITANVAVIDRKGDVAGAVSLLKERGRKVVLIDNYSSDRADAVIIPYAAYRRDKMKKNYFAGRDFIIIGENFLNAAVKSKRIDYGLPLKVLVTMGGADPNSLTEMVLKALSAIKDIEVTVVVGPVQRPGRFTVELETGFDGRFRVLRNITDLAPLMISSHVAFTALGITVYELAYLGTPSIIIGNYESDMEDLEELQSKGVCIGLGFYNNVTQQDISSALMRFIENRTLWRGMSAAAQKLTDGCGADRVADVIAGLLDAENTTPAA